MEQKEFGGVIIASGKTRVAFSPRFAFMDKLPAQIQEIVQIYAAPLTLYARQFFAQSQYHDAEEVVQDVFFRLSKQGMIPENVGAWLYKSVRNGAISLARSEKRRDKREQTRITPPYFQPVPQPDDEFDSVALKNALESLEREQREIVTLHLWGNRSFAEIGELLAKSKTTVFRRYEEALEILRQKLQ